ncbi:hypothetical protein WH47_05044, partial [Habropoda laboriosa]
IRKKRKLRRGCRAGRSFKDWKKRTIEPLQKLVPFRTYKPQEVLTSVNTVIIDLTISDDEDTVPFPSEVIETLDTRSAITVQNHRDIPDEVLVAYLRGYKTLHEGVPTEVADWCLSQFESQ